jgi:hypothetical protein
MLRSRLLRINLIAHSLSKKIHLTRRKSWLITQGKSLRRIIERLSRKSGRCWRMSLSTAKIRKTNSSAAKIEQYRLGTTKKTWLDFCLNIGTRSKPIKPGDQSLITIATTMSGSMVSTITGAFATRRDNCSPVASSGSAAL